jgi:hypothetical protein
MNESTQAGPHSGSLDLVIGWLGGKDEEKVEKATLILLDIGQRVVEFLLPVAMKSSLRAEHRVRLLDLIQQIGQPLGVDDFFNLQRLLRDDCPAIREKVEEVFMALSPGGLPKSPEAAALAKAFNPAFWGPPRCPPRRTRLSDFAAALRGDQAAIRRRARSSAARQKRDERKRQEGV